MYLHLGADCMIKNTDIIAIFNIRDQQSEIYDNYISVNKDKYKIIDLSENGECSSCILTTDTLYLSGISALTLKRRAEEDFGSDQCDGIGGKYIDVISDRISSRRYHRWQGVRVERC